MAGQQPDRHPEMAAARPLRAQRLPVLAPVQARPATEAPPSARWALALLPAHPPRVRVRAQSQVRAPTQVRTRIQAWAQTRARARARAQA